VTRPIYEPTLPRTLSAEGYQRRQLLRRPAAGSAGAWEWMYAAAGSSLNVSNNVLTAVEFTQYAIQPDATMMQVGSASGGISTLPFEIIASGIAFLSVQAEWSGSGYTDIRMAEVSKLGGGFWINIDSSYLPRVTDSDPYIAGQVTTFGPMFCNANSANKIRLGLNVQQRSGSTQTFVSASLGLMMFTAAAPLDTYDGSWFGDYVQSF